MGMLTFTREDEARALLAQIGNTHPTQFTVDWVVAWSQFETTKPQGAYFNILNTTQRGYGDYQGANIQGPARKAGVRDYPSFDLGVQAQAHALESQYYYPQLSKALKNNDVGALSGPSPTINKELNTWGTGRGTEIADAARHRNLLRSNERFLGSTGKTLPSSSKTGLGGPTNIPSANPPSTGTSDNDPCIRFGIPGSAAYKACQELAGGPRKETCSQGCGNNVVCLISCTYNQAATNIASWGVKIGIFVVAIVLVILGVVLLAQPTTQPQTIVEDGSSEHNG